MLGEVHRARALLDDGVKTVPTDPTIWKEYVSFEQRHRGPNAAANAKARARSALGVA